MGLYMGLYGIIDGIVWGHIWDSTGYLGEHIGYSQYKLGMVALTAKTRKQKEPLIRSPGCFAQF